MNRENTRLVSELVEGNGPAAHLAEATNSLSLRRLLWLQRVYGLTDFVGHDPQVSISAIGSPLVRQIFATAAATRRATKHRET